MKNRLREFVENKLPEFYEVIFSLVKAKNVGIRTDGEAFQRRKKEKEGVKWVGYILQIP